MIRRRKSSLQRLRIPSDGISHATGCWTLVIAVFLFCFWHHGLSTPYGVFKLDLWPPAIRCIEPFPPAP